MICLNVGLAFLTTIKYIYLFLQTSKKNIEKQKFGLESSYIKTIDNQTFSET